MSVVTVIYKSGVKIQIECQSFEVRKIGGELQRVIWDSPKPKPLFFGIDDVAAIYEGKA